MRSFILLGIFMSVLTGPPGFAAETVADREIAGAFADLKKYEVLLTGPTPPTKPTASRTLRLLKLTRERLDASDHQHDPSWIEADARLVSLVSRLEAIRTGGANPASVTEAQPEQRAARAAAPNGPRKMIAQQRTRLTRLIREIAGATETLDQNGVEHFQNPAYVEKQLAALSRYQEVLAQFDDFAADPDVVKAGGQWCSLSA